MFSDGVDFKLSSMGSEGAVFLFLGAEGLGGFGGLLPVVLVVLVEAVNCSVCVEFAFVQFRLRGGAMGLTTCSWGVFWTLSKDWGR